MCIQVIVHETIDDSDALFQSIAAYCSVFVVEQEMDIESLEAANQSLQADLKLAFKRIGDLQAAIEDDMESDDNDDLISR